MSYRRLFPLLLLGLAACASSRTVVPGTPGMIEANRALAGRAAEVHLSDGRVLDVQALTLAADTTTWFAFDAGRREGAATADVLRVVQRSRGRGLWQGALITGAVAGAAVGTIFYLDVADTYDDDPAILFTFSLSIASIYAVPGAIPGALFGFLHGAERRYEIAPAPAQTQDAPDP